MKTMLISLLPLAIIFIAIAVLKRLINAKRKPVILSQYEKQSPFLSPAERSFLGVLEQAVQGQFRIFCKVRMSDIIKPGSGMSAGEWRTALNRIQNKHVDFVLCTKDTVEIEGVAELDDKSHQRDDRQERDGLVDAAMKQAGIPIFHFSVKRAYTVADVRSQMFDVKQECQPPPLPYAKPQATK